jgi:hypothetical protein
MTIGLKKDCLQNWKQMKDKIKKIYIALATAVTWLALGIAFYINLKWASSHGLGPLLVIWNFLSYFTHLSNLLAGLTFMFALICPSGSEALNHRSKHISAVAIFIIMAGIIFNLVLRQSAQSGSLNNIANILLHDVNPMLFLIFWWFYTPNVLLKIKDIFKWLTFPVLYFFYLLIRGHFLNHYPYPFVNVEKYGYGSVFGNGFEMLAGFLSIGMLFIAMDKLKLKRASKN